MTLCHSSWVPCEYCCCKGTKVLTNNEEVLERKKILEIQKKIVSDRLNELASGPSTSSDIIALKKIEKELNTEEKKLKAKKSNIVWPASSAYGPRRKIDEIFEIIQQIENDQPLTLDEAKGVVGRSPLFDLPNFHFIRDVPVDYLHCVCLGVVKRSLELTFKLGESRPRITNRPLSSPLQFNRLISAIKVIREFNRRVRDLDFAVYKGQEYRNLLLFFFPLILKCIPEREKERNLWLFFTYMVKACVVPNEEYEQIQTEVIVNCQNQFYLLYQELFGVRNCTYNTHVMGSHLPEMRYHGPLTLTSAFPFESFYGELRNSFVPGTVSGLKQIFSNVLMKRAISSHKCQQKIFISPKDTNKECNSIIYTYGNCEHKIYKVHSIDEDDLHCQEIITLPCTFVETPDLDWSLVGVFKNGGRNGNEQIINTESVKGKVLQVDKYLITCPNNIIREK